MIENSSIKVEFWLVKADAENLDLEDISKRLNLHTFESSQPKLSKGVLNCTDVEVAVKELRGMTIDTENGPPYKMIKHAYWRTEILYDNSKSVEDAFAELKILLSGKEKDICDLCSKYNLFVDVIVRVYATSQTIPEISLSSNDIAYLASINASLRFDFQLE